MKLTDIDLSSLAEVAAAVTLLEHMHRGLADRHRERNEPLPTIIPGFVVGAPPQEREGVERFVPVGGQAFVVNPAPSPAGGHTHWQDADAMERFVAAEAEKLRGQGVNPARETEFREEQTSPSLLPPTQGSGETMMTPFARQQAAPISDAEKLRGMGVNPMTASESHAPMDAATVFGQSAAPLPPAPSTAGVAASPTAPAAPPASGALPTLPALAPLPAPSAAAPTAPAALSSPAGGVELDTDGLPWDERIHAGTKRKNADGRWTSKRGINDPDLVPRVVAQLRAQMAAGGVTATASAPHVKAEPVDALKTLATLPPAPPGSLGAALGVPQMTLGQLQEAQMLATLPPAPAVMPTLPEQPVLPANPTSTLAALQAAMTPASAAPAPTTFQDFMTALTVEVQAGRVPIEALGAACQPLGGVSALNAKPELIPVAWASLKAKYPGML